MNHCKNVSYQGAALWTSEPSLLLQVLEGKFVFRTSYYFKTFILLM